jgi:dTDP-4-amino-4,6-dideoxygalactose transaminase
MRAVGTKLAIDGGEPVKKTPSPPMFPGGMEIGEEERQEILEVLESKRLFRYYGPEGTVSKVAQFELEFGAKIGTRHALAVNSGTSALIASLVAAGLGPGDEVVVPGYTFIASCMAILAARAIPVIAEVDSSLTLDPQDLQAKVTPRTKAVVAVHMRGAPCDMGPIMTIAERHGLKVVEDVAQAAGGSYHDQRLGSFGDCNAFSLQYHKIITGGEGGAVTTNDPLLYDRAQAYHDTAACWRPDPFGPARYSGEVFPGENYRMGELAGAVALAQLRKLDGLLGRMRVNKSRIKNQILDLGLEFRRLNDDHGDTAIALIFYLPTGADTAQFAKAMRAEGIPTSALFDSSIPDWHVYAHWRHLIDKTTATAKGCPYTCAFYQGPEPRYTADMCPKTLELLGRTIHINIPPQLTEEDCDLIALAVRKVTHALL